MLGSKTLQHLDARIKVPAYDRAVGESCIVHLGLHCSHFCCYLHQLLEQGLTNWGIEEPTHTTELASGQEYLYTLSGRNP